VDALVRRLGVDDLPRAMVVEVARAAVAEVRDVASEATDAEAVAGQAIRALRKSRLIDVVNASGVLLHTNLGRAPLHPDAAAAAARVGTGYSNLELDLATGRRGGRGSYVERLLRAATGAQAALVVNNNAGALLLALAALASGRSVPVSRGELIEIGGSYRLPELMTASGCRLVEVGTTNRTRINDYRQVVGDDTAALLKVHPSNYRLSGFTEEAPLHELVALGEKAQVPVIFDAGSGLLDADVPWLSGPPPSWLAGEPGIRQAVEAGVDLAMFSGDKLLGGPQAGLLVGRADLIGRLRRHPMARALRVDAATLKALEITLEMYADGRAAELPFWRMAGAGYEDLEARATRLVALAEIEAQVVRGASVVGAGSVPGAEVPSPLIVVAGSADPIFLALLSADPPVLARRFEGRLVVDLRAVPDSRDEYLASALAEACRS
jgi:L-seryl-tRNA(Ser) seleniumtransferase